MNQAPVVLYAEDNRGDVLLVQRTFRRLTAQLALQVVEHGDAAVEYLAGEGDYCDRDRYPLPNLMLLDLNMPRRSGFEVLEWLQSQPSLQFPVAMLTTSDNAEEVAQAYSLGASFYLIKPLRLEQLIQLLYTTNLAEVAGLPPPETSPYE